MRIIEPLPFWQSVAENPDRLRPYGTLIFIAAAILFLIWLLLASIRRRIYKKFGAAIIVIALIGYVAFDLRHFYLNLRMRNVQRVRADCIELLQRREAFSDGNHQGGPLRAVQVPSSFARMGAKKAEVGDVWVGISFIEGGWGDGSWGFVYYPRPDDRMKHLRPTWYRDFYEYRYHGD